MLCHVKGASISASPNSDIGALLQLVINMRMKMMHHR